MLAWKKEATCRFMHSGRPDHGCVGLFISQISKSYHHLSLQDGSRLT